MAPLYFPPGTNNQQFTASNNIVYVYQVDKWTSIGAIVDHDPDTNTPSVTVSSSAPSNPPEGALWFNTSSGKLNVYSSNQWVLTSGS
jgi:hypothetical protein